MNLFLFSVFFFFLMIRHPPISTRTDTLFPYTTLFRSPRSEHAWHHLGDQSTNASSPRGRPVRTPEEARRPRRGHPRRRMSQYQPREPRVAHATSMKIGRAHV